jgi:uncharacterized membrane protein
MNLETSKNLGGVGALLIFISFLAFFLPYGAGGILGLIGLIILLIGMKGLADYYQTGGIFNNALYAVIIAIVGVVAAVGTAVVAFFTILTNLGIDLANLVSLDASTLSSELISQLMDFASGTFVTLITALVVILVVLLVFAILAAFFFRKSLSQLSSKAGVGLFGTAGLLMLVGAVLIIIVGIGLLLIWIAFLLAAIAFFQIKAQPAQAAPTPQ